MKKAIIYSRVSTLNQDYRRQVHELEGYAAKHCYEVIEVFTDVASGKSKVKDRKASKAMLAFIRSNRVAIVLVSELSRLGRSAIDVQNNIHMIVEEYGLNLYVHQQGLLARDSDGRLNSAFKLVTDVMANVAQMEREQLSDRVKSGLVEARRKGKVLGRPKGSMESEKDTLKKYPKVRRELKNGLSLRKVAKLCDVSVNTVRKVQSVMKNNA